MSFADWLEKHADQELEIEVDDNEEEGLLSFPEWLENHADEVERLSDALNKTMRMQAEANAKAAVYEFLTMDNMLKEQGYEDNEERLRIIEIIF